MTKFQLFCGESKERATGIGGIIFLDDRMQLAVCYPGLPPPNMNTKQKYFVNFENLVGKLTEIVSYKEYDLPPFKLQAPPYVYEVTLEDQ